MDSNLTLAFGPARTTPPEPPSAPLFGSQPPSQSFRITGALSAAAQATSTGGAPPPNPSRFDLYGTYSYIHPVDSDINHNQYQPIQPGSVFGVTGYFNKYPRPTG